MKQNLEYDDEYDDDYEGLNGNNISYFYVFNP